MEKKEEENETIARSVLVRFPNPLPNSCGTYLVCPTKIKLIRYPLQNCPPKNPQQFSAKHFPPKLIFHLSTHNLSFAQFTWSSSSLSTVVSGGIFIFTYFIVTASPHCSGQRCMPSLPASDHYVTMANRKRAANEQTSDHNVTNIEHQTSS